MSPDIITGKCGHIYEHSEGLLGLMFMPPPTADQPWCSRLLYFALYHQR